LKRKAGKKGRNGNEATQVPIGICQYSSDHNFDRWQLQGGFSNDFNNGESDPVFNGAASNCHSLLDNNDSAGDYDIIRDDNDSSCHDAQALAQYHQDAHAPGKQ